MGWFDYHTVEELLKNLRKLQRVLLIVIEAAEKTDPRAEQIVVENGFKSLKEFRTFFSLCGDISRKGKKVLLGP